MINLEQVKLLEAKVVKTLDYVEHLLKENAALHRQESEMQAKLDSYQQRIDELEALVVGFKEDQGQIEEGILAALDRLSQFEKAFEKTLDKGRKEKTHGIHAKISAKESAKPVAAAVPVESSPNSAIVSGFEIPESADEDDIQDPLEDTQDSDSSDSADGSPGESGELDIF